MSRDMQVEIYLLLGAQPWRECHPRSGGLALPPPARLEEEERDGPEAPLSY